MNCEERLSAFSEKEFANSSRVKFYIALRVFMYTQKIAIIFDHSRLGLENKFFLNKIAQSPTYDHLYFIRLIGQPRNIILPDKADYRTP